MFNSKLSGYFMKASLAVAFFLGISTQVSAQFTLSKTDEVNTLSPRYIVPNTFKTFEVDHNLLFQELLQAPNELNLALPAKMIQLPMPDGSLKTFRVFESPIYEPELAIKFPNIKTYSVVDTELESNRGRIDISPYGFHAVIRMSEGMVYVDPYSHQNTSHVISYYRKDYQRDLTEGHFSCGQHDELPQTNAPAPMAPPTPDAITPPEVPFGSDLRTFRLALACTGEYTAFHGGTAAQAMAAMTTSINRVNEIYENDLSVRLILVGNTNLLIELDGATDPYTNGNTGAMINESQTEITAVIGSANFDIGHLFGTNSGGLAGLGVVCNNFQKARGVTGSANPVNDPFDIDYVCHEVGHQFGGAHTQNNTTCNRSANSAYEPGSASTIMGYAGICAPNLQGNSDAFFNTHSIEQMENLITNSATCHVDLNFNNTPPTADAGPGGYVIPVSTPFELTGSGSDIDGDAMTYNWEEHDLGPGSVDLNELNNPTGTAPIFRSWLPTNNPTRVFPRIQDLVNNTTVIGELLPTYSRELNFRFTVRDNHLGSGGYDYDDLQISSNVAGGPFLVNFPNGGENIAEYSTETITWDVANTDLAIFNSPNVDIFLSLDGGLTYPITLAQGVPNDGSETIQFPLNILPTGVTQINTARIKIKSSSNIFFDISNNNFTISQPVNNDFGLEAEDIVIDVCSPEVDTFDLYIHEVLTFTELINLSATNVPGDATITFEETTLNADDTIEVYITPNTLTDGDYTFTINGNAASANHSITVDFSLSTGVPATTVLTSPADVATNISYTPNHQWNDIANASQYQIQVATDELFTTIVRDEMLQTNSWIANPPYTNNTTYFWRVKSINGCGESEWSDTLSFTTTINNPILGCTDPAAFNYNPNANIDDGSCVDAIFGCTNVNALNYDPNANTDDGSCIIEGCTNPDANNYNPDATTDDGSCVIPGCTDPDAFNYNADATIDDGSCVDVVEGCTDVNAFNYNAAANTDDGSCITPIYGCIDPNATNYNPDAVIYDGSCTYAVEGCTDPNAHNYNPDATVDNGTCTNANVWLTYEVTNDSLITFEIHNAPGVTIFNTTWTLDDGTPDTVANPIVHYYENDGVYHVESYTYTSAQNTTYYIDTVITINFRGCTDPNSANFEIDAVIDDGSCTPHVFGCTDPNATNYNADATLNDNSCIVNGCTDVNAINYNPDATVDDGSCIAQVLGCTDETAFNYNPNANTDDGSCEAVVEGCTDPLAFNYNANANTDDGSCIAVVLGCTDETALNYDAAANTDDGSCQYNPNTDLSWTVTPTSENHTILVPSTATFDLNGNSIANGDIIGVFFVQNGTLQCGGKITWNGNSTTITAYGNDEPNDNGFEDNEAFQWKIWDASEMMTYNATVTYDNTLPQLGEYENDGISGILGIESGSVQNIDIETGWNFISTNLLPANADVSVAMAPIASDIELAKDENGQVYWPEFNINNIGNLTVGKAYKVNANSAVTWAVSGSSIDPSLYPLSLPQGWSYLGYLREASANISSVMNSVASDIFLVKNLNGDTYWPAFNINNIGNMEPGVGYQINMTNAATFTFPSNSTVLPSLKTTNPVLNNVVFTSVNKTQEHMHVAIPVTSWKFEVSAEDEIGVFNQSNELIGAGVYNENHLVVTIFGNQDLNQTPVTFKLWDNQTAEYSDLLVDDKTSILYGKDQAFVINSIAKKGSTDDKDDIFLIQEHGQVEAVFTSLEETLYQISVYNGLGQLVSERSQLVTSNQAVQITEDQLQAGVYFIHFNSDKGTQIEKVLIK